MNNRLPFVPWGEPVILNPDGEVVRSKPIGTHIAPQGPSHSSTPDSGSGTAGRPMLIVKSDNSTGAGLGNQPWPVESPPITPGDVSWNPPSPLTPTPSESPLVEGIWGSRFST